MYWITGLLGGLLILAPFAFGFTGNSSALWSAILLGAITLVFSLVKAFDRSQSVWEYWVIGLMGILAAIMPFVLAFLFLRGALEAFIPLGVLIFALAAFPLYRKSPARR